MRPSVIATGISLQTNNFEEVFILVTEHVCGERERESWRWGNVSRHSLYGCVFYGCIRVFMRGSRERDGYTYSMPVIKLKRVSEISINLWRPHIGIC